MSCEFLLGFLKCEADKISGEMSAMGFAKTSGLLNSYPFSIPDLEKILKISESLQWYIASKNGLPDLEFAYDIRQAMNEGCEDIFELIECHMSKVVVFFSDIGTNDLEVHESMPIRQLRIVLRGEYEQGAPLRSTVLVFSDK
ncbi:MAG: hypothetical protein ABW086_11425 [Sedimenticola sp.]